MNQANFLLGYEVITMIIVLFTTKEKSLGTDFNQENLAIVLVFTKTLTHVVWYSPARNAHARLKDIYLEIHPSSPLLPEKLMAFKAGQTTKVWSVIPRVIKVQ